MANYFVTGATGFIGRFLVEKLLARGGNVYCLVRENSRHKLDVLQKELGATDKQLIPVIGDLGEKELGIGEETFSQLPKIDHFFHLAAIYDMKASAESQQIANVEGTRNAVSAAMRMKAGQFNHVSSIAAAGLFRGYFREDMFAEAENLDHPYFKTKHESEKVVREACKIPYRIFRPAMVVGHSRTGQIDKIDGPYYFFKLIQGLRRLFPQWVPLAGIEGGKLNIVPVDFVVDAMDYIAHLEQVDSDCFHLTDSEHHPIGDVLNIFARAAHAPEMAMRIDTRMFSFIPPMIRQGITQLTPVKRITDQMLEKWGIPRQILAFINYPTRFDNRETIKALEGSGIQCPPLTSYAPQIWDYWERNLDPDLFIDRSLQGSVSGKVVVVTGASSGIGKATALKLGEAGAKVILVARDKAKLEATRQEIIDAGGTAFTYSCDLNDMDACDRLVASILTDHKQVDVLINNAGRSIRRSIENSYDRFHDFQRTMQLNYFGSLRLIMGFLPSMEQRKTGHIINISSIGVLTNAPRFSAYVASKAALDAFTRCAASEFSDKNIHWTVINMPLVRTPMIAPTKIYDHVPAITPEEAADMVADAIVYKHKRIATRLGITAATVHALAPKVAEIIMNTGFKMFPDSPAAKGDNSPSSISNEQVAFSYLMRGIHW